MAKRRGSLSHRRRRRSLESETKIRASCDVYVCVVCSYLGNKGTACSGFAREAVWARRYDKFFFRRGEVWGSGESCSCAILDAR